MKRSLFCTLIMLFVLACQKDDVKLPDDDNEMMNDTTVTIPPIDTLITGYNVRWRDLADFEQSKVLQLVDSLNPEILRYPGGTLAHRWNWHTGISTEAGGVNDVPHPITDVKRMSEATASKVIFVVDIVKGTLEDQISMLQAADVPVEYIEIGNELYADDYEDLFPNGAAYADTVNAWVPALRQQFPGVKIGAVMIGRTAGNDRKNFWNTQVHDNITTTVDAYIYHIYVKADESVQNRLDRFYQRFLPDTGKELWITEYGTHSQNINQAIELAEAIDAIADLALNHCIVSGSGNFSKLTEDCNELTAEGKAFVERYRE